ncbi:MAG: selenide, water dikinase SelD, partial [Bacteroides sp.]|nr:selenide, water dikinase SelD [Bacteroides sp.]
MTEGPIQLTHFTHGLGCACKIRPQYLEKVLQDMPQILDPRVLVGTSTSDDAAVYKITDDIAIVQTVDFFTPIVDDPYAFGAIAAANALSDIYAMGARPLFALNIVGFPSNRLPMQVLKDILKGASDKATEAGIPILGGHTVEDNEPKFGMVVTGQVHPKRILTNSGAKPGDVLILTKPIGTGIISTAVKRG